MTKNIIFGLFSILVLQQAMAQEQLSKRQRADQLFERYEYNKCLDLYLDMAKNSAYDIRVLERLADCYRLINKYPDAENWYARVLTDPKAGPVNRYYYAQVLLNNQKIAAAKDQFIRYYTASGNSAQLKRKTALCDSAAAWLKQPSGYQVKNEQRLNSSFSDWGPAYIGKADLIFTSDRTTNTSKQGSDIDNRTGKGWFKLYEARAEGIKPLPLSANESYHIGPMAVNATQDTAYITVTTDMPKSKIITDKNKTDKQRLYTRRLQLMVATKRNGRWGNFTNFAYNNVNAYSTAHAALSANGQLMYFTSDMPGGEGKTDIWYCEKQPDGTWGKPVNCGKTINTADEEAFAAIGGDGALYFASKGLPGMGGFDIFKATGNRANWGTPVNLKYPVNSTVDDFCLITRDRLSGYFSSNRQGGKGDDDIYSFNYKTPDFNIVLKGYVYQKNTGERIDSAAVLLKTSANEIVNQASSSKNGDFIFKVDKGQDYLVEASKMGFFPTSVSATTKGIDHDDTLYIKLPLEPLQVGKTFVLKDIYYDLDKSNIRRDAAMELDKLATIMHENPSLKIELSSHTDSRASDDYNMALSDRRAKAAVAYLIAKGVAATRMIAKGYGETRLLNQCANGVKCTDQEHQLNRRTEIKVLE